MITSHHTTRMSTSTITPEKLFAALLKSGGKSNQPLILDVDKKKRAYPQDILKLQNSIQGNSLAVSMMLLETARRATDGMASMSLLDDVVSTAECFIYLLFYFTHPQPYHIIVPVLPLPVSGPGTFSYPPLSPLVHTSYRVTLLSSFICGKNLASSSTSPHPRYSTNTSPTTTASSVSRPF